MELPWSQASLESISNFGAGNNNLASAQMEIFPPNYVKMEYFLL
jgi:hypothetical protein